jgi:WhiB family redox-sensing transcriptional regulator
MAGERESWRRQAACADTAAWWFARPPVDKIERKIHDNQRKRICAFCPVREECRAEARELMEPAGVWGGETPEERIDGRLNDTHGPVPRNCATCKELFVAYGVGGSNRVTCSEVCAREHKRVRQNLDAAYKRQRHDKKRPCPICGETQNMASGTCAGWKCVVVRKNESRRRVLA